MGKLITMKVLIVGLKGVGIETGEPNTRVFRCASCDQNPPLALGLLA